MEALKTALLPEIDDKVAAKVDELWQKGKVMLGQVMKKQKESTDHLSAEITKCLEKQAALEQENEKLKQVLLNLSSRLGLLSTVLSGGLPGGAAAAAGGGAGGAGAFGIGSSGGDLSGVSTASGLAGTPVTAKTSRAGSLFASPCLGGACAAELPEVPPFPFPAAAPHATTPLCLAEALGGSSRSPPGTPAPAPYGGGSAASAPGGGAPPPPMALSLANSLQVPPEVFSFTLRKADGNDLGLNVSDEGQVIVVESIRADGAIDAWNRQCMGGASSGKVVKSGDKIIGVNNIFYNPAAMLEECKEKRLFRLTIFRGDGPLPDASALGAGPPQTSAADKGSMMAMRAEASEFVPSSLPSEAAAPDSAAGSAAPGAGAARTEGPAPPS